MTAALPTRAELEDRIRRLTDIIRTADDDEARKAICRRDELLDLYLHQPVHMAETA